MPTLLPNPRGVQGFTLIEILIVLGIVSLLATVAIARIGREPAGVIRARELAAFNQAVAGARARAEQTGRMQQIDPGLFLTGAVFRPDSPDPNASLSFFSDGSSSGGLIERGNVALLKIDWMTGGIERVRP